MICLKRLFFLHFIQMGCSQQLADTMLMARIYAENFNALKFALRRYLSTFQQTFSANKIQKVL